MDALESVVRAQWYVPNRARLNLGGEVRRYGPKGKPYLVKGHLSNTLREGRALELAREMLGDVSCVCLNKGVCCAPHRDKGNSAQSWVCYFGDFQGGALCLEDGRRFEGVRQWHGPFDGKRLLHWNEEHTGDKYSIVAFA